MRETSKTMGEDSREHVNFVRLFTPLKHNLYNYIIKSLNFSPDGDDLFQETSIKAFKYFPSFRQQGNFKSWIFTIAHNLIKDHYKKKKTIQLDSEDHLAGYTMETENPSVKEIYLLAESMKPKRREIFFLYYDQEFTVREISRIIGESVYAIKFHLYQGRQHIKKQLEI